MACKYILNGKEYTEKELLNLASTGTSLMSVRTRTNNETIELMKKTAGNRFVNLDLFTPYQEAMYINSISVDVIHQLGSLKPKMEIKTTPKKTFLNTKARFENSLKVYDYLITRLDTNEKLNKAKQVQEYLDKFPQLANVENIDDLIEKRNTFKAILDNFDNFKTKVKVNLRKFGLIVNESSDKFEELKFDEEYYRTLINEEETEESFTEEERFIRESFEDGSAFLKNPRDTASARVKQFFAVVPSGRFNSLGLREYMSYDEIIENFLQIGSELPVVNYENLQKALKEKSKGRPYLMNVSAMLGELKSSRNTTLLNEILTFANKAFQEQILVKWNKAGVGVDVKIMKSNRSNVIFQIYEDWLEGQKTSKIITSKNGQLVVNNKVAAGLKKTLGDVRTSTIADKKAWVKKFMSTIGVQYTDGMIDELEERANEGVFKKGGKNANFNQLFEENNLFSLIVNKYNSPVTGKTEVAYDEANNALKDEHSSFNILAEIYYDFTPGRYYTSSSRNGENKSIYAYIEPSMLERLKKKLKYGTDQFGEILKRAFAKNSNVIQAARKSKLSGKNNFTIEIDYADSLKQDKKGRDGVVRKYQSPKEQTVEAIFKHQNNGSKTGLYNIFTLSNKTVTPVISITKYKLNDKGDGRAGKDIIFRRYEGGSIKNSFDFGQTFKNELYNLAESEINRIVEYSKELKAGNNLNEANFDKAFELFYLFPVLNKGSKDENGARMEAIRNKMYQGEYPSKEDQEYIKNELIEVFKERVVSTISTYVKDGIITKEVKDGKVDLSFPFFDNGYMLQQEVNGLTNLQKAIYAVSDFKFNYLRTQITALQMLGADPALFYKAPKSIKKGVDINTLSLNEKINIVRTTMDEFSKRAAMFIAPGGQGVWTWYDENGKMVDRSSYRTITMNDVVLDVPLGGDKVFTGVETTDAQEFITLQEHIDRLLSRGRIPLDIWQSITNKIVSKLGSNYQLSDREKGFVFQPLKPVYTNSTEVGGQFTRVDYVKSSSYPLIPDVIAGTPLDELRKMMENNNIRSGNFKSAKKTGQPGKSVTVFDEKGNFVMPSKKDLEGATQVLSREGLHDQQEIPPQKQEIANISQMNRTLFDGLMEVEDFVLEGEEFNAKDFKKLKENIRISLFSMAKSDILSRFGFEESGKSLKLKNKKAFESLLLEEALERGYSLNDISAIKVDEKGDLVIPPYLMARSEKFEGLINSLLTKIVKQKNPGTSLIQVSGVTSTLKMSDLSKDVKNDIIWLPSYDPKAGLMYMRKGPDVIDRKGKVKKGDIKPAQVIVSQYIRDEEGNLIDLSKFVKKDKSGRNILDTSSFSEELFQLVASRIPNQSHPSTLPIEVVGFLPSYMENTIIVPNGITKQMGSDFDVDKLYAYLSTFRFRYSKKAENTIKELEKKKIDAKQTNEQTNTELFKKLFSTDEANLIKDLKASKSKIIDKMKWDISQKEKARKQKSIDNLNKLISNLYENIKTRNEKEYLSLKRQQEINNKKLDIELANIDKEIAQAKSEGIVGVNKVSYDLSKYDGTYESLLNNMGEDELHQMYRDLHWSVLTHPETFDLITKSIDFPDIAEEEKLLESIGLFDSDINYTPMDVEEQIQVFIDNKSGGVGTGVFANLGSFLGDNQDKTIELGKIGENGQKVINPITVLDDEGNKLDLYKITEYGSVEFERKEGDEVFLDKRTKADNNTMLLSESVDNAKNKKLYKFNWSDQNMSAITGIIALSSGKNEILKINFATRFFKQNIVTDYNKELANLKDSLNDFIPDAEAIASAKVAKKYQDLMSEEALKERLDAKAEERYKPVLFGAQNLLQLLKDGKLLQGYIDVLLDDTASLTDKKTAREFVDKYANAQLDLFELYLRFNEVGSSLGKVISAIYPYAKGVGSTIFDLIDNSRKLNNLSKSNLFLNLEQLAGPITTNPNTGRAELINPKGEIGHSINMSIMLGEKIYEQLYPIHFSANYKDLVDKVFAGLGIDKNTIGSSRFIKLNKQLIKAIRSYLFTSPSLELAYDIPAERKRLLFESEDNISLAKRVEEAKAKYPELEKNYFFNNLKTRVSTVNGGTSQIYYNNPFGDVDELENNKGYLSLIFSGNDELISIAKDLALYTYITGGNQNNSSFGKFIPVEYFISDKDFIKGMQGLAGNFYGSPLDPIMYKQIIQNNPDLATRIDKKVFDVITAVKDYKNQEKFTVDVTNDELLDSFLVSSVISDGLPAGARKKFADFVVYYDPQSSRNYLYERISSPTKGVYQRVNTLGTSKAGFVEYSYGDDKVDTLLQLNMTAAQYANYASEYKKESFLEDDIDLDSLSDSFFSDPNFDLADLAEQFDESYDNINLDNLSDNSGYTPTEVDLKNPALYTDHSGGAPKADSVFDEMGKRYGVVNFKHYYDSSAKVKPPLGNTPLNKQQMAEGIAKVKVTYTQMGRPDKEKYYSLHGRNWFQVKNADAIFAVSDLVAPGEMGRKGFINRSGQTNVEGGTGYAVQMAINEGKPVYVYHQNVTLSDTYDEGWYMYDYNTSQFVKTQTPKLTLNFAGIGTSTDLTAEGVEAIENLYKNTFGSLADEIEETPQKVLEGDIFSLPGIPVITTNLEGVHGAGLAQAAKAKGLIKQGDGEFKATDEVVQLPVKGRMPSTRKSGKGAFSESVTGENVELLKEGLRSLISTARNNPSKKYLLPLAGLGHGEGSIEEILPLLIKTVQAVPNISLVLPAEGVELGRQGTIRKDYTRENMPQIKKMLYDAGLSSTETPTSSIKPTIDTSREWRGDLESRPVYTPEGVNTMRTSAAKPNEHFGNPFSEGGYAGTVQVPTIGTAVKAYKDWLLTGYAEWLDEYGEAEDFAGNVEQRQWILDQINQGKLDGATLLYAGKSERRGQGMHPTALAEVVEELRKNVKPAIKDGVQVEYTPKGKTKQTYTAVGGKIFNSKGQEVFKEESRDRNKIYANVAIKQGRAVVVEYKGKRYVVNDKNHIMSVQTGDIMNWGPENGDRKGILALADDLRNYNTPVDEENLVEEDMVNNNMMTDPVLTEDELAANIDPDRLIGMDEMDKTEVNIEDLDNQPIAQKRGEVVEQINDPITSELIPDLNGINDAKKIVDNIFKTTNNPFFKTLGKTISTAFLNKVSIVVDTNLGYPGVYNSNLIRINPSLAKIDNSALSAKDNLETVIMHEIMHAYTADIIKKFEDNPSSLTPKVREFADKINKMYIKTRNELMRDPKHSAKLSSVIGAVSANNDNIVLDQSDKSNYYGLTNLNEFVSMIMTDRGFQQFMNTVMHDIPNNQSVFEKFKALLKELISALASSIGIAVQPDSVLNSGVSSVVGIIKERETQDFTPAENDNTGDANEGSFKMADVNKEDLGEYDLLTPNGVFDANEDQINAINKVSDFFNSPIQDKLEDNVFLLYGPGGTGKTASLASAIRKSLKQTTLRPSISYAAISHTAKGELVKAGNEDASTFASLVGARPVVSNTGEESFELLPLEEFTKDEYPVPFPSIFTADWIIIDESSMIGEREMKAIRQRLNERQSEFGQSSVKILFMGDYAQIAPVGVEPDGDGWPIKLMNNPDKSVGLSKVERTKNQDITDIGFRFRRAVDYYNEQLKKGIPSVATPLKAAQILSSDVTTSTTNVKFTKNESTFIKDFVDIFRKDPLNSANAVIISYNNEKHVNTVKTTDVIRKSLFGKAAENNLFLPGEPIFITSTITTKDLKNGKSIELSTNSRVIVKNIKSIDKEFNVGTKYYPKMITVPIYDISAYFGDSEVNIQAFDKSFLAQLKNYTKKNGRGGYELEDGSFLLYSDLMKLKQDKGLTDIFHGYVMSSHKVQGQTYNYPFVNEKNIFSFIRMGADNKLILTPKDYSRIMYTAVSRARNKVYILSDRTKDEVGTFVNPVVQKPMQSIGTQDVFETEFPKDLELENQCKI